MNVACRQTAEIDLLVRTKLKPQLEGPRLIPHAESRGVWPNSTDSKEMQGATYNLGSRTTKEKWLRRNDRFRRYLLRSDKIDFHTPRRGGREAEGGGLLNRYTG